MRKRRFATETTEKGYYIGLVAGERNLYHSPTGGKASELPDPSDMEAKP